MNSASGSKNRTNPWFRLVVLSCAVFIFTIFLMLSAAFNARMGRATRFFNDHGMLLLGIEVGVILGLSVVAMSADRRHTLRELEVREAALLEAATRRTPNNPERKSDPSSNGQSASTDQKTDSESISDREQAR
jgi:hypothetical protein